MKLLLKNGKIYDGTGAAAFSGDILVEDDRIAAVGTHLEVAADRVLDLQGKSVASGFIDGHSHNDWFAIRREPLPYFAPFLRQGITSFVAGNCGLSAIGFEPGSPNSDHLGGGLFGFEDTTGRYGTLEDFFAAVDGNMPCNLATFVGHCSARAAVAGKENRPLTPEEEERMLAILEKALQQGAAGISLGLMYEPGLYAGKEELTKVAALCAKYGKVMSVHPRANSAVSMAYPQLLGRSHLLRAVDELVEIARQSQVRLHYSHAIFVGRRSFKNKEEFLKILQGLRREGIDVMFDIYNETVGVSVITVILPAWYQAMTPAEKKKSFNRLKLAALVKASSLLLGFGFKDIQVAHIGPGYESYEGKTVHEIARELGVSDLKAYLRLCEESNFAGRVNMGPYTTPEILSEFQKHELCLFMTDAWVEARGIQNPAIYDCYPKFLKDALTGVGDSLPGAIRRMTGGIADRFGLEQRGYVKPGYFADLTVFDEAALAVGVPDQGEAFGIEKVFVNGRLVVEQGRLDEAALATAGRVMRVRCGK